MPSSTKRTRRRVAATAAAAVCTALLLAGCGTTDGTDGTDAPVTISTPTSDSPYQGTALDRPFSKPDTTLTDTDGKPFDLRERTKGRVTLLYFGYTHCPDVCPTTLGDIAFAKKELPKADQDRLDVIMITTDPERDTPERMRSWLDSFDKSFIGLTGEFDDIAAAGKSVGVAVSEPEKDKGGDVIVDHGAQVLAYAASDDRAHVLYTAGTEPEKYAHDLPLLLKGVKA